MANLSENPQWVDGIYQIETSDPVVGGPDGVSNRQAKELASRTRYLKKEQEKTGSDLATHAAAADPHTQYAPKANPTFTGTPKAPTPAADSNSQQVATTAFVKSVAAALVNGAPAALDTLQELAKAMGNDPNFSATVLGELAKKLSLSGGTLTGELLLSAANALRLIYGDYGVIIRNDGNRFYLLLTNKGDKTGSYNSLRPLDINLATGDITVGHNLNVTGLLNEKGQRVYSPNNKPTAADVGALTDAQAEQKYIKISSPVLAGKPTAPTAAQTVNDTQIATTAFVKTAVAALVNGSPATLDTLQELAKALGNDPNFSTTILNILAGKLSLSGGKMSGRLETNDIVKITGAGPALPDSQGAFLCWNRINGQGRTDFVNHRGNGSGGFTFWNGNHEALNELASLNASGSLFVSNSINEAGKRVYSPNNKPTAADIGALSVTGGTITGNIDITTDSSISWRRNTDIAQIGFKNLNDADTNSYMYFRTGDNNNEYFRWEYIAANVSNEWMSLKNDGLRIKGNLAYHAGNKPTAIDIGAISVSELAGVPFPYPSAIAPAGWLKCNGQAFDKAKYPVLGSRYPAGKLPDLRGEFIRGWDDGKGVDTNRGLMSSQSAFIPSIPAEGWGKNGVYPGTIEAGRLIVGSGQGEIEETLESLNGAGNSMNLVGDNRPRNIAFNYIVRAA